MPKNFDDDLFDDNGPSGSQPVVYSNLHASTNLDPGESHAALQSRTSSTDEPQAVGNEFEFGDEAYKSYSKLPRIKPDKPQQLRFALIAGVKPKATDTHFIEGNGTFVCHKQGCAACKAGNPKIMRIVALAVKYSNASLKDGKLGSNQPTYEIGWVLLSRANYTQMLSILPDDSTPYTVDWKIGHSARAFGYEFSVASSIPAYVKCGAQAEIEELAREYMDGRELTKKLGKMVPAMELKAAVASQSGLTGAEASLENLEDL
jgi:hypothetical protein